MPESQSSIPNPSHRHAAPSAPWPWMDIDDTVDQNQLQTNLPPVPEDCDHRHCNDRCWNEYPKSRFPNWTEKQVKKSNIWKAIHEYDKGKDCIIHHVDVNDKGLFANSDSIWTNFEDTKDTSQKIMERVIPDGLRVRALFIENLSGPVLQMLGAKYNIEPFFFSSSLNWIPSRYQEDIRPGESDRRYLTRKLILQDEPRRIPKQLRQQKETVMENLRWNRATTILDLLSVHLFRRKEGSVIISYHPNLENVKTTTARDLKQRIQFAGQSVYWQNIFQKSTDPTFVLLTFVWHAIYAWDEALENLYIHICALELHTIRAHLLHYASLLEDIHKTVEFIRISHYPALEAADVTNEQRNMSKMLMERECNNLLSEISRLEKQRVMQAKRLKNVMGLVFNSVNINDSKRMQAMTEAAVRDSAAMKQIAYLTMIFLPASYVAAVFGMNVKEIVPGTNGALPIYICIAIPLTIVTVWIIIAFHSKDVLQGPVWRRLGWPYLFIKSYMSKRNNINSLVLSEKSNEYNMV
ncbi:hypothetical protein BDQ17DRAFT_1330773 [Cyathus striatus]|nr:hypothetical protein BDQ17DRAFT_1330773 [Cyathus striatus]